MKIAVFKFPTTGIKTNGIEYVILKNRVKIPVNEIHSNVIEHIVACSYSLQDAFGEVSTLEQLTKTMRENANSEMGARFRETPNLLYVTQGGVHIECNEDDTWKVCVYGSEDHSLVKSIVATCPYRNVEGMGFEMIDFSKSIKQGNGWWQMPIDPWFMLKGAELKYNATEEHLMLQCTPTISFSLQSIMRGLSTPYSSEEWHSAVMQKALYTVTPA